MLINKIYEIIRKLCLLVVSLSIQGISLFPVLFWVVFLCLTVCILYRWWGKTLFFYCKKLLFDYTRYNLELAKALVAFVSGLNPYMKTAVLISLPLLLLSLRFYWDLVLIRILCVFMLRFLWVFNREFFYHIKDSRNFTTKPLFILASTAVLKAEEEKSWILDYYAEIKQILVCGLFFTSGFAWGGLLEHISRASFSELWSTVLLWGVPFGVSAIAALESWQGVLEVKTHTFGMPLEWYRQRPFDSSLYYRRDLQQPGLLHEARYAGKYVFKDHYNVIPPEDEENDRLVALSISVIFFCSAMTAKLFFGFR